MKAIKIFAAAIVLAASSAHAQEFVVAGAGTQTCKQWAEAWEHTGPSMLKVAMLAWVQGLISGTGAAGSAANGTKPPKFPPADELAHSLDTYCAAKPGKQVVDGAMQLLVDIGVKKPR